MSDPTAPLTVRQAIAELQHLVKQGHGDLFLQYTSPCGLKTLVTDLVTGPADFGLLVEVR